MLSRLLTGDVASQIDWPRIIRIQAFAHPMNLKAIITTLPQAYAAEISESILFPVSHPGSLPGTLIILHLKRAAL